MNASSEKREIVSLVCAFVNITFYRDNKELALSISACTLNVLFALCAAVFNSVVLFAIWKTRSLHTPSNILLGGLAASDLAVGCAVQPLYIATKLFEMQQLLSPYCRLRLVLETVTLIASGASFLILTSISLERFLALYLHLRYNAIVTCRRTATCLASSWLLSGTWALSRFWLQPPMFAAITGSVIIVSLLMNTWAYAQIFRFVKRHKTQIENVSSSLQTSCSSGDISKYIKTVVTMATLLLILIVSYASFVGITNALAFGGFGGKSKRALSAAYTVLSNWIFVTASLNPVLYCWRLEEIRQAVMKLFFKVNQ